MKNLNFLILLWVGFISYATHSQEISGDWYGNLNVQGMQLPLVFHITQEDSGYSATMDSPQQGAFGIKVDEATFEDPDLRLLVKGGGIIYEGTYDEKEEVLKGTLKQGGMNFPLELTRNAEAAGNVEKPSRPQEPRAPFPYHSEEVTFNNPAAGISLAGTLSLPSGTGNFPAVILISGSGPQDRNAEVLGHKPFLVIADHLSRNGIAVLRFDERGVGESQGDFPAATTRDLSKDVEAAVNYLSAREEINKERIGLIGHSEGGIIAPMVANETRDVDFLVLLAGPALRGDKNILLQKKLMEERSGIDAASVGRGQEIFEGAYKILVNSNKSSSDLSTELKEYFDKAYEGKMEEDQLNSLVQQLTSPWMNNYLRYDPVEDLEQINIPVLALFGEKDFQVSPAENSAALKEALEKAGNQNVQIMVLDDLNHLFQESTTGLLNEYQQIEQTISPEVLKLMTNWILQQD